MNWNVAGGIIFHAPAVFFGGSGDSARIISSMPGFPVLETTGFLR